MAYQHFFSRVPARCSMFKRTDDFDTFIKSAEIDKAFIDRELSAVCEYKLTKNEMGLVREGKLAPAYVQFFGKNGEMIQSCISYLPRDYTGERSAYMIHSLVLSDEEKLFVSSTVDKKTLNEKMFVTDIEPFRLTAPKATPKEDYATLDYVSEKTNPTKLLVDTYHPKVLKQLIFALLYAACGKGKPVFITLDRPIEEFSYAALDLMNTILLIFPFNVRRNLSFITYQSDYTKFNACRVHFLPSDCMAIPTGKGYTFDMTTKLPSGIRDEEYASFESVVEFFYHIAVDNRLRTTFLKYYQGVVDVDPSMEVPTLKTLTAMVTLFRQISGAYSEKALLPDDNKVYEMITVYEKHRNALKPSERSAIYACLKRYPRSHTAIPNNIFSKITKLYPTEPAKTKNTVMEVILELLHTDIMREKLFSFVKANYAKESPKNRAKICEDLARVFYGGFLQPQILAFFAQYYKEEAEDTRDLILEKCLLAIRTPAIQDKILELITCYYGSFTEKQKDMFYKTAYEMLPESDSLTVKMLAMIDQFVPGEPLERRNSCAEKIVSLVEANQRKQEHHLAPLVWANSGFCRRALLETLVTKWASRRIFEEYTAAFATHDIEWAGVMLVDVFTAVPYLAPAAEKNLETSLIETLPTVFKGAHLYRRIAFYEKLREELCGKLNEKVDAFVYRLEEGVTNDAIVNAAWDSFRVGLHPDPINYLVEYATTHPFLKGKESYLQVERFGRICRQYQGNFDKEMIHDWMQFPLEKNIALAIAKSFEKFLAEDTNFARSKACAKSYAVASLLVGYLKGNMSLDAMYSALEEGFVAVHSNDPALNKPELYKDRGAFDAIEVLSEAVILLYESEMPEESKAVFTRPFAENGEVLPVMKRVATALLPKTQRLLKSKLDGYKHSHGVIGKFLAEEFSRAVSAVKGSPISRILSFFGSIGDFFVSLFRSVADFFVSLFRKIFKK